MSKMTTQEFLDHLGIEVGKEFMFNEHIIYVDDKNRVFKKFFDGWALSSLKIGDLLDKEITPLPKYTLTEDEKVIVRQRYIMGFPYLERKDECVILVNNEQTIMFIEKEMFPFIEVGEKVLLDELRKCL